MQILWKKCFLINWVFSDHLCLYTIASFKAKQTNWYFFCLILLILLILKIKEISYLKVSKKEKKYK